MSSVYSLLSLQIIISTIIHFVLTFVYRITFLFFLKLQVQNLKKIHFLAYFDPESRWIQFQLFFLNCKIRHFFYYYRQDLPEGQLCRYFVYSRADFGVFRPAGATRCTDQGQIWQGGADAHPAGIAVTRSSHCFCF